VTGGGDRPAICEDCGSQLQHGQRYCLGCGERIGPASPQLLELLRRGEAVTAPGSGTVEQRGGGAAAAAREGACPQAVSGRPALVGLLDSVAALRLPSKRVSALLVLAFLGFGVLLGNVAGSRVDATLAASARPPLKLMLPPAASADTGPTEPASSASEPPAVAPEATPAAAPASPETASAPAPASTTGSSTPSSSNGSESDGGKAGASKPAAGSGSKLPAIKHVFVIMLSDQPYAPVFGPDSSAGYLQALERRGELLVRYYAVAHRQLANGIALVSGQGPTLATEANCTAYVDVTPATLGAQQQVAGDGCVYPAKTETLAGQLTAKHLTWRAYVQGMDEAGSSSGACAHPQLGAADPSSAAAGGNADPSSAQAPPPAGQPYATLRNPFVYFHSLIDSPTCAADDVGLSELSADLSSSKRTPSLSYIVPDRCHDASPGPCPGGAAGGLPAADGFLRQLVPKILGSIAYKDGGLLVITVDQAPTTGEFADSSSCCGQPRFPNLPVPTGVAASLPPEGGGQVGALLLSPFVKAGTTNQEPYNHFSLLRTIEDLFGLKHLGYAADAHVGSLEPSLFAARPGA
jgi:hypothetical protein